MEPKHDGVQLFLVTLVLLDYLLRKCTYRHYLKGQEVNYKITERHIAILIIATSSSQQPLPGSGLLQFIFCLFKQLGIF